MTFTGMIAILVAYFAAVIAAAFLWKPRPPEPPQNRERKEKLSFRDFHRSHVAKPVEREPSAAVYGQRKQRA
jgi:hypothetical protein